MHPIPDPWRDEAARLWRQHFGQGGWPRTIDAGHGVVALRQAGTEFCGVMGMRDAAGGFGEGAPPGAWLFRSAPGTRDLVIDGVAVARPRQGAGRALVLGALALARARGHPGLRAEVRAANAEALAFYRAMGFQMECQGRFGLPWWGQVQVLRLPV